MSDIPTVTSLQCVAALRDLGFAIEGVDARTVVLSNADARRVFVRRHTTLSPNEVRVILMAAMITTEQFSLAVARRGSGSWVKDQHDELMPKRSLKIR